MSRRSIVDLRAGCGARRRSEPSAPCSSAAARRACSRPQAIATLLEAVRARLDCAADLEVTLEANPGAVEHGSFRDYRDAGVNRLSLGVQSFERRHLVALGRIHDERAAHAADRAGAGRRLREPQHRPHVRAAGADVAEALADVRAACAHAPAHISHYQLTLEPGTPFHRNPPSLPDDEACDAMQMRR